MTLKKQVLSGVFWTSIQQFSSQGVSFLISVILARLLLPEEFGLIGMIGVFIGLGGVLMDAGLCQSLIRTTNPDEEDFSTVFYFNILVSILIYLVLFFSSPYIAAFFNQDILTSVIRWYCITFIINAFYNVQSARLSKNLDFKTQMKANLPALFIGGAVGVIMALKECGVWSLVGIALTQSFMNAAILWIITGWKPLFSINKDKFKIHFSYGYKITLSSILDIVFNNLNMIVIGKFFTPVQVGYYNRADSLKQFPVSTIGSILGKVTFPLFAEIKDDNFRLKEVYKKIMQMVTYVLSPMLLILAVLAEPLFIVLFTDKWLPAVPYFQILCWNGIMFPINAFNLDILKVKGRSDLYLKLEFIKKILLSVVIFISFQFGIYGLLYGSVITSLLVFVINTYYTGKFIDYSLWQQIKDLLPIVILAFSTSMVVFIFDFLLKETLKFDILRLCVGGMLGIFTYIIFSYLLKMTPFLEFLSLCNKKKISL